MKNGDVPYRKWLVYQRVLEPVGLPKGFLGLVKLRIDGESWWKIVFCGGEADGSIKRLEKKMPLED